jgi:hypothetical protein
MGTDGHIKSHGSLADALTGDANLREELAHEKKALEADNIEETIAEDKGTKKTREEEGKLTMEEEQQEGNISLDACELSDVPEVSYPLIF